MQEPAILSTSISPDAWSGNVHFKMNIGPGVKGLYVDIGSDPSAPSTAFSNHPGPNEREIILPPNTRFVVNKISKSGGDPDGFGVGPDYVVEVTVLPSKKIALLYSHTEVKKMNKKSDIDSKVGSSGWHVALAKASAKKPYLGDPDVVAGLVRKFVKGVLDRYDDVQEGRLVPWSASQQDRQSCETFGKIFAGMDDDYETIGTWNTDELSSMIVAKYVDAIPSLHGTNRVGVVVQFFAIIVHLVYQAVKRYLKSDNDIAMESDIGVIVTAATQALIGVDSGFDKLREIAQ